MTAKEKAIELFDIYESMTEINYIAKQCALVAVDEMIEQQKEQSDNMHWSCVNYWEEVKQEIEKL
jgi:hypothetical protein